MNPVALERGKVGADEATYSNPVAIAGRDGTVHLLFCYEFNRCFYLRSDDDGVTFSSPVEFTAALDGFRAAFAWKVVALGPMHGIELASGRLVVAVWFALGTQGAGFQRSAVATIYSDDQGRTWRCGDIAIPPTPERINPNSPAIAQVDDGKEGPGKMRDRRNLSIHLSYDNGMTWAIIKSLEPGDAQFSDLGLLPDGRILCLYESGQTPGKMSFAGHNIRSLIRARFNLDWLTDGKDAGERMR